MLHMHRDLQLKRRGGSFRVCVSIFRGKILAIRCGSSVAVNGLWEGGDLGGGVDGG